MRRKNNDGKILLLVTIILVLLGAGLIGYLYFFAPWKEQSTANKIANQKDEYEAAQNNDINQEPIFDYESLEKDKELKKIMKSRKEDLGINKSLDMIVESDESFKVGKNRISMQDVLKKAYIKKGDVFEEKIDPSGTVSPENIKKYGIYVVQTGDNIWDIHFNFLKEFYARQGIKVSKTADEPAKQGMSSGIGKILKFSETMVIIYNFKEKKIDTNIDLLEPLNKIIVYNMEEIFSLLRGVNYENIDRIRFDGTSIWIPVKKT